MKKINLILILTLLLMLSVTTSVLAEESIQESAPTGNELVRCETYFNIIDKSETGFSNDIVVVLTDIATGNERQLLLTHESGYTGNEQTTVFNLVGNTTYEVEILFSDSDLFKIVDENGNDINKIAATESGLNLYWNIVAVTESVSENELSSEIIIDIYNTDNEILKSFVEKTSFIESHPAFKNELRVRRIYMRHFIDYMGGTEEQWDALTPYEIFCIQYLYLMPVGYSNSGDYNYYFRSLERFLSHFGLNSMEESVRRGGASEEEIAIVREAFEEALTFQYNHFVENGTFLNLFTDTSYAVESNTEPIDLQEELENQAIREAEELESISNELLKDAIESVSENNTIIEVNSEKSGGIHIIYIIIIIAIVAIIGFLGFKFFSRNK